MLCCTIAFDMIVLPGGQPGTDNLNADKRIIALLQKMAKQGKHVAAICAAPPVLAGAGLLDGKKATSFPTCPDGFPNIDLQTAAVDEARQPHSPRAGRVRPWTFADAGGETGRRAKRREVEAGLQR